MRSIKFRAWEENAGFEDGVDMRPWSWKEMREMDLQQMFNNPKYKIMQYIGLKDKRGVEIYEGDILSVHDTYMKTRFKGDVRFCNGTYFIYIGDDEATECCWCDYETEVIGNIYEHPHLLEESE